MLAPQKERIFVLLAGPIFSRELAITPRRTWFYFARSVYLLFLLLLMSTAWLVLSGTQYVQDLGDLARFGDAWFQIAATMQLVLALFSAGLVTAGSVSQEKDRRTLDLLLMTHLSNAELVLGKWLSALVLILVVLASAAPFFVFLTLFGGVDYAQIARVYAVTVMAALAGGAIGSTIAFWREKAFQSLALTVMALVLWFALAEVIRSGVVGANWLGIPTPTLAKGLSPWWAVVEAARPFPVVAPRLGVWGGNVSYLFLTFAALVLVFLHGVAIWRVRVWNPSREVQRTPDETGEERLTFRSDVLGRRTLQDPQVSPGELSEEPVPAPGAETVPSDEGALAEEPVTVVRRRSRQVWDNPVLWREMCTWAYGRRMLLLRLSYLFLFALAAGGAVWLQAGGATLTLLPAGLLLAPLVLLSLALVNAQAVTSVTSERDGRTLDLLLVSDITPREFVLGKLGGVFYNTKEMVVLPMGLAVYLRVAGAMETGDLLYLLAAALVLYVFVAMLGVHTGLIYFNSRSAVAASLGTVFFLFVGVAVCMRLMLAFSGTFQAQLHPFLAFMVGGGAGMYWVLGARNPSKALGVASFLCPLATFYALTSVFLEQTHLAFVAIATSYGFATMAMLIPAIDEFDVATGRTTYEEG